MATVVKEQEMGVHYFRINRLWLFVGALLLVTGAAWAVSSPEKELAPTIQHRQATGLITHFLNRYHYKRTPLDDELSEAILERYLKSLDPNRSYFLASDIRSFSRHESRIDDLLREGNLDLAFDIFHVFMRRLEDRVAFAQAQLERGFDFTKDEEYVFDRSEAKWPADRAEADDIWRRRVKNDVLSLRLAAKPEDEITDTLHKRYERLLRRGTQMKSDDVYQLFINAYTMSVEPHTAYFSPRTSENFRIRMSLSLEGIGAALQTRNEHTVVLRIIKGGPADKSGLLQPDDRITGVAQDSDGEMVNVVGWRIDDVVDLIRGPKSSVVRLEVLPKGSGPEGARKVITLVRNRIELEEQAAKKSVIDVEKDGVTFKVGVIDVPTFYLDSAARARGEQDYRSTTRDVRRLLKELEDENVDGVIIDLRGNGGGSLLEATELTGLFIESGPIVQVKDATGRIKVNMDPNPDIAYSGPLEVLVDRNSASASEIFAGAVQDYGRGLIVGEPTYGKGTVQNLVDLDQFTRGRAEGLGQLKFTIAQFFRVSGGSTQHRGVVPDILLPGALEAEEHGERSLDNALPWASVRPVSLTSSFQLGDIAHTRDLHEQRVQTTPAFTYLREQARLDQASKDDNTASLLESVRRTERKVAEQERLEALNTFRAAQGKVPYESVEAAEKDEEDTMGDVILEEAAHVLRDSVQERGPSAAPEPIRAAREVPGAVVAR